MPWILCWSSCQFLIEFLQTNIAAYAVSILFTLVKLQIFFSLISVFPDTLEGELDIAPWQHP